MLTLLLISMLDAPPRAELKVKRDETHLGKLLEITAVRTRSYERELSHSTSRRQTTIQIAFRSLRSIGPLLNRRKRPDVKYFA